MKKNIKVIILVAGIVLVVVFGVILVVYYNKNGNNLSNSISEEINQNDQINNTNSSNDFDNEELKKTTSKDYNQVIRDLEKKLRGDNITNEEMVELGAAYYNVGKIEKSEEMYNKVIEKDPNLALAYGNLANIYRDRTDFAKSEEYYKKAISLDPKEYRFYVNLAFIYKSFMNNSQGAINVLNQGLQAIPDSQELKSVLEEYNK